MKNNTRSMYFDSKHEIPLVLENYGDIFSDFDPRQFRHRALSTDFLNELKRASIDKENRNIEIKFILPKKERNLKDEIIIKKRLKEHFKKHFVIQKKEIEHMLRQGYNFIATGIALMLAATWLIFYGNSHQNFFVSLLTVFFEPGGWFLFWEGLNLVIFESKKKRPDYEFYEKMSRCRMYFSHPQKR